MNWLDIDFAKCDKTENKSLVVTLKPHWSPSVSQEGYDVKLPFCPNVNEIIFSKDHYDGVIVEPSYGAFVSRKKCFIKTLYLDLETLFTANTVSFDFPCNEYFILSYQSDIILVSPIEHKEFCVPWSPWLITTSLESFIGILLHLYKNNKDPLFNGIKLFPHSRLSREVEEIAKLQAEILSNFSEEEIKAMDMEESPLYLPIVMEGIQHYFNTFVELIHFTNNKEVLNRLLTDERSSCELSGEAKAIIIKRMAELDDERSFEL